MEAVSDLYPGLVEKARDIIESSEREYEGKRSGKEGGFLWEHTVHVASLAHDLAVSEGLDPVLPSVAALFHDAGKFRGGEYHKGDRPEEEDAAALAVSALEGAGAPAFDIAKIRNALRALYDEKARRNALANVVHDADFLSKFGYLGVAGFFLKSALRGKNLVAAVMSSLSKELTYAEALPRNMRTAAGRKAALKRSRDSLRFFRALLKELADARGTGYKIRKRAVVIPGTPARPVEVLLVVPEECGVCGGEWTPELAVEKGVKCRTLEARLRCAGCGDAYTISFCLPEVV
ncbi:MAG TPA: HD domain-containing protein [Acidobacteriota bacterium]|nr:HD domain-containing protein [Acidobacteriota bacterium]